MALLDIHVLGSPILRRDTEVVRTFDDELRRLADDMFETMHAAKGVGLAAPQVGRLERMAVIDVGEGVEPFVIVNPEIVLAEGTTKGEEGCLSIPEIYGDVERAARVTVRAQDLRGEPIEVEGTELLGRCLQHEIDHLHGRIFLDHLGAFRRRNALAKWEKMKQDYPSLLRKLSPADLADHKEDAL